MPKKGEDSWGGEGATDDFPEEVYSSDSFAASEDSGFSSSDGWGVPQEAAEDKWDSFVPDDAGADTSADGFVQESQETWTQPPAPGAATKPGKKPAGAAPQFSLPANKAMIVCPLVGAADLIRGGILGSIFGSLGGVTGGYSSGLRGPMLRQYVVQSAKASAMSFSLWLGTFSGAKCTCAVMRGKKDVVNSFVGGAMAGVVASLRTRNPRAILMTSTVSGILASVIDSL